MKHAFIGSEGSAGTAPVQVARPAGVAGSRLGPYRPRKSLALAVTIVVHAVVGLALWYATPSRGPAPPPQRIEVALIAPPERIKPPPPPPPKPVRRREPTREPQPSVPVQLDATPLELPRIDTPVPPSIPIPDVLLTAPSPITAMPVEVAPPAETRTSPPAPPAPPPEQPVTPPRFDAAYLDNPPPSYPPAARRAREQGRVLLRVLVTAEGRARTVSIAKSSGSALLDQAAVDAVRRWRFVPARRGDIAIEAPVLVPIAFTLTR